MIMHPSRDDAARRSAFASMVAHELRTPLTAAFAALEMMAGGAPDAGSYAARDAMLIGLAHRNTLRLLRIVEDCLDLEAASDDRLTLQRAQLDSGDLVALGVDGARCAREQTGVDVLLHLDALRPLVGDRLRLGRALTHLVQNAVTFAPPGTVVTVTTSDVAERDAVRLFDVREAPGRRRVGGLGLGLAFVRTIAELHGGTVQASSEPGHTTIAFEVPAMA